MPLSPLNDIPSGTVSRFALQNVTIQPNIYQFSFNLRRGLEPSTGFAVCPILRDYINESPSFSSEGGGGIDPAGDQPIGFLSIVPDPAVDIDIVHASNLVNREVGVEIYVPDLDGNPQDFITYRRLRALIVDAERLGLPSSSGMGYVQLVDRRIEWKSFGAITLEANTLISKTDGLAYDYKTTNGRTVNSDAWSYKELVDFCLTKMGEITGSKWISGKWTVGNSFTYPTEWDASDFPVPFNKRVYAGKPVEFLADLLRDIDFQLILDPDGTISFVKTGSGIIPHRPKEEKGRKVKYRTTRTSRPDKLVIVGDAILLQDKFTNCWPVLRTEDGIFDLASSAATSLGYTWGKLKNNAFVGATGNYMHAFGDVTDGSGKTFSQADADTAQIRRRQALLSDAFKLWQVPATGAGKPNQYVVPIRSKRLDIGEISDQLDSLPIKVDAPQVAIGSAGHANAGDYVPVPQGEFKGTVSLESAEFAVVRTSAPVGVISGGARLASDVQFTYASGVDITCSWMKHDFAKETEITATLFEDGDPMQTVPHFVFSDPDQRGANTLGDEPHYRLFRAAGVTLKIDKSGATNTSNVTAIEAGLQKVADEFFDAAQPAEGATIEYAGIHNIKPSGIIDSVEHYVGPQSARTTVQINDPRPRNPHLREVLRRNVGALEYNISQSLISQVDLERR